MKSFTSKFTLIAWLMTISVAGFGINGGEKKVNLRGNWKFSLGDNMNFAKPSYNDSDWEKIYVPASWQSEGFRRYSGYAWYRTTFEIEYKDNEPLYLELGKIDDADEVYINGHKIGGTGGFPPSYFTAYSVNRNYPIPTQYLVRGKQNVIAVRVYDEGGEGGIIGKTSMGIFSYQTMYQAAFPLLGNWKFHLLDNPEWSKEDFKDDDWEDIAAPSYWEDQGFRDYNGFAWYRKKIVLPKDFKTTDMVILLGRIDDMDEVFINGKRVGYTGNIERKWAKNEEWRKPRTYFIPDGILKAGKENTIAVRVYDQEQNGGMYDGPLAIINQSDYKKFWKDYQSENHEYSFWSFIWD